MPASAGIYFPIARRSSYPNGVDCEQFRPGLAQPQPATLIFAGALAYRANHEAMQFFLAGLSRDPRAVPWPNYESLAHKGVDLTSLPLDPASILTGFLDDIRPEWPCLGLHGAHPFRRRHPAKDTGSHGPGHPGGIDGQRS